MYLKKYGKKAKNIEKKIILCGLEGHYQKELDPDPLARGTDPRIRIRTKMSWIRNTV